MKHVIEVFNSKLKNKIEQIEDPVYQINLR